MHLHKALSNIEGDIREYYAGDQPDLGLAALRVAGRALAVALDSADDAVQIHQLTLAKGHVDRVIREREAPRCDRSTFPRPCQLPAGHAGACQLGDR